MNSIKVIRPKSAPQTILIRHINDMGWYSYEDNSGIFYGNKEKRVQFNNSHLHFINGGAEDMYAYPIEVDMTIQIGYIN